jgi:hypothetical protein
LQAGALAIWLGSYALTAVADDTGVSESIASPGIAGGNAAGLTPEAVQGAPRPPELVRITSSFEVTHAGAVLRQVARLFSEGFVRRDAEQVAHLIDALAAEQTRSWDFSGVRKGVAYPLRVRARIDAFGTLDLDFFAPPAMAGSVREAVDGYLNARGL